MIAEISVTQWCGKSVFKNFVNMIDHDLVILTCRKGEREEIQDLAEAFWLSVSESEYVWRRSLGSRVDSVTDVRMLSELRRQGGLLKKIFNETNGMYSENTAIALDSINKFVESLEEKVLNDDEKPFMFYVDLIIK